MKKLILIITVSSILQSCCVYHETKRNGSKKTSEYGFAKYENRPISQAVVK